MEINVGSYLYELVDQFERDVVPNYVAGCYIASLNKIKIKKEDEEFKELLEEIIVKWFIAYSNSKKYIAGGINQFPLEYDDCIKDIVEDQYKTIMSHFDKVVVKQASTVYITALNNGLNFLKDKLMAQVGLCEINTEEDLQEINQYQNIVIDLLKEVQKRTDKKGVGFVWEA